MTHLNTQDEVEQEPGIIVPDWLITANVSSSALFAYVTLSAFADEDGEVRATNGKMAGLIGASVSTWIRCARELVAAGAIETERVMDGRMQTATVYKLPHHGLCLDMEGTPKSKPRPKQPHRRRISAAKRLRVYERDGFKCVTCGTSEDLTLDHVVALANGGTDEESNLQTMCMKHNAEKGAK